MLSAPTRIAPAASSRAAKVASALAGARSRLISDPARVVRPATSNRFFTANGAPASGPSVSPRARLASIAVALASARLAVTSVKAPSLRLSASMRSSVASTISRALASPLTTAARISSALIRCVARLTPYTPAPAPPRRRAGSPAPRAIETRRLPDASRPRRATPRRGRGRAGAAKRRSDGPRRIQISSSNRLLDRDRRRRVADDGAPSGHHSQSLRGLETLGRRARSKGFRVMRVFEHAAYPTDGSSLVVGKKAGNYADSAVFC